MAETFRTIITEVISLATGLQESVLVEAVDNTFRNFQIENADEELTPESATALRAVIGQQDIVNHIRREIEQSVEKHPQKMRRLLKRE